MAGLNSIRNFLSAPKIAFAGVSRDTNKFSSKLFIELRGKGTEVLPINPNVEEIFGVHCYSNVLSLPDDINHLYIVTPAVKTEKIISEAIQKGIKHIWIQQASETKEAVSLAKQNGIELIYKRCLYMFLEPVGGPHKFHRFFVKLFGRYPK